MHLPFTHSKGKKRKSAARKALSLVLVPITIFFAVAFVFFWSDDFWLYAQMMYFADPSTNSEGDFYMPSTGQSGVTGSWGGNGGSSFGQNGLNLMLMNQMTGGYCADWLTLARDHCNRKYMSDDVKFPNNVNPSIVLMTGTAMKETGLETITLPSGDSAKVPKSSFNLSKATYGSTVDGCKYDLWNVSSQFLSTHLDYVNASFESSLRSSSSGYYGTFQMSRGMLSRCPTEPSASGAGNHPSTLKGYGMEGERSVTNGDFGFFPDQMSSNLQSCWTRWATNYKGLGGKDIDFSRPAAVGLGYAATNAGEGNVAAWFGLGTVFGSSNKCAAAVAYPAGEERGACVADAMNQLMDMVDKIQAYISANPEVMSEALYLDRRCFHGMSVGAALFGCKNGFLTSTNKQRMLDDMSGKNFAMGVTIAYRVATGKLEATPEDVRAVVNGLSTTVGDERKSLTGAYNLLDSKGTQYSGHSHLCVHFEDTSRTFQYNGKTYPVIHAADIEPAAGIFWIPMGGAYLYWKMLTYAGVECRFEDVVGDGSGGMITEIPPAINIANPGASSGIGNAIALRMAQISFSNMDDAKADYREKYLAYHGYPRYKGGSPAKIVCGIPLYLKVHDYCLQDDPSGVHAYYASCDRGTCTAVRWAGADDSFPVGACYGQLNYFVKSSKQDNGKWVEVHFGGDPKNLQPGDILMRSDKWERDHGNPVTGTTGHIVTFVGRAAAEAVYPNQTWKEYIVGHSSYNDRAPALGNWYTGSTGLDTFRAFRCVRPETNSKYSSYRP